MSITSAPARPTWERGRPARTELRADSRYAFIEQYLAKQALVFFLTPFLLVLSPARAATEDPASPFGMCSNGHIFSNPEYKLKMLDAGARICRVDASFSTSRVSADSNPDHWNWETFNHVRKAKKENPEMDWLPILGYEPKWAQSLDYEASAKLYGDYVFEAVKRYKSDIHYWESWNEPDLPSNYFFRGSGKDFLPFQKACYMAAKKADPSCKVVFAGMCFPNGEGYLNAHKLKPPTTSPAKSSFFEDYLQACLKDPEAKQNNFYFDIMNQHSYSRATDLYDYTEVIRLLMREYMGAEKPIWYTETGITDAGGPWGCTPDEYCDYLLQSYCWARSAGVQRIFHFQLDNSNGHGLYTSMLGGPKPALSTYKNVLTKQLADFPIIEQLHGNHGVGFLQGRSPYSALPSTGYNLFEFKNSAVGGSAGTKRVLVCFTDSSADITVKIPTRAPHAVLVDRHTNQTSINSKSGFFEIQLKGATNNAGWPIMSDPKAKAMGDPEHLIGGATIVVIERQ